jgi:hypothetical protein
MKPVVSQPRHVIVIDVAIINHRLNGYNISFAGPEAVMNDREQQKIEDRRKFLILLADFSRRLQQ